MGRSRRAGPRGVTFTEQAAMRSAPAQGSDVEPQSPDKDRPARRRRPPGTRALRPACGRDARAPRQQAIVSPATMQPPEKPCTAHPATRFNDSLSGDWEARRRRPPGTRALRPACGRDELHQCQQRRGFQPDSPFLGYFLVTSKSLRKRIDKPIIPPIWWPCALGDLSKHGLFASA